MKAVLGIFNKKHRGGSPKKSIDDARNNRLVSCHQTKTNAGNKAGIISNLNSLTDNKVLSEFSTKFATKDGIDYIFSNAKSQILDKNSRSSSSIVSDLTNTFKLNHQMLARLIQTTFKDEQLKELEGLLKQLELKCEKKSKLLYTISEIKGRNLITGLINAENRRKYQESLRHAKNQITDLNDCLEAKLESRKSLEKKLKEYEKYVQKHSKNSVNERFAYLRTFDINKFTEDHINLVETQIETEKIIQSYQNYINELRIELCQSSTNRIDTTINESTANVKVKESNTQLNKIKLYYINQVKQAEERRNRFKQLKSNINSTLLITCNRYGDALKSKSQGAAARKNVTNQDHTLDKKLDESHFNDILGYTMLNCDNISRVGPRIEDNIDITCIPKKFY